MNVTQRPKLVNSQRWDPFKKSSGPQELLKFSGLSGLSGPSDYSELWNIFPKKPIQITREDIIRKNSIYLNVFSVLFLIGFCYFLYEIYLERQLVSNYVNILKSQEKTDILSYSRSVF